MSGHGLFDLPISLGRSHKHVIVTPFSILPGPHLVPKRLLNGDRAGTPLEPAHATQAKSTRITLFMRPSILATGSVHHYPKRRGDVGQTA